MSVMHEIKIIYITQGRQPNGLVIIIKGYMNLIIGEKNPRASTGLRLDLYNVKYRDIKSLHYYSEI